MDWENPRGGGSWNSIADANNFAGSTTNEFADIGQEGAGVAHGGHQGGEADGQRDDQDGHTQALGPEPPKSRACFNCGEEGHAKAECPNPAVAREFTGNCRICDETGHRAADCPTAPPKLCSNCKEEGHSATKCTNPRKIDRSHIADIAAEFAWVELEAASAEGDIDDMKMALAKYIKATPDTNYVQLETAFRRQGINLYLIALEKELEATFTNMDLQGNLDKKYSVSYRKSPRHARPKEKEIWPQTPEENFDRLTDAGDTVDRGIPKCLNCDQLGHTFKHCSKGKQENPDRVEVKCFNCAEVGHRVRDCPNPRPDKFACRNCHQSGHSSKECPEPRSAEGVECKKCSEIGHFSRDCPQGGGGGGACHNCGEDGHRAKDCTKEKKLICRNCDAEGHLGKECPKPHDYSRVKCSNCDQMGHTKVRCKEPPKSDENADGGFGNGDAANSAGQFGELDFDRSAGDTFGESRVGDDPW